MVVAATSKVSGRVRRIVVKGNLPADKYGEVFRLFVGPASRLQPKRFDLGLQLEIEPSDRAQSAPTIRRSSKCEKPRASWGWSSKSRRDRAGEALGSEVAAAGCTYGTRR